MELSALGRLLLIGGVVIALLGLLLIVIGQTPLGRWLTGLPGTLRVDGVGFSCIIPIAASLLLSLALTVILNLVIRWLNRP